MVYKGKTPLVKTSISCFFLCCGDFSRSCGKKLDKIFFFDDDFAQRILPTFTKTLTLINSFGVSWAKLFVPQGISIYFTEGTTN